MCYYYISLFHLLLLFVFAAVVLLSLFVLSLFYLLSLSLPFPLLLSSFIVVVLLFIILINLFILFNLLTWVDSLRSGWATPRCICKRQQFLLILSSFFLFLSLKYKYLIQIYYIYSFIFNLTDFIDAFLHSDAANASRISLQQTSWCLDSSEVVQGLLGCLTGINRV